MNKETLLNIVLVAAVVIIVYILIRLMMRKSSSANASSGRYGTSISDYLYVFPGHHPKSAPTDNKCKDKDASGKCEPTFIDASGQGWCLDNSKNLSGCPCYYYKCSVKPADQTIQPVPSPAKPADINSYSRTYSSISSSLSSMASGGTMRK